MAEALVPLMQQFLSGLAAQMDPVANISASATPLPSGASATPLTLPTTGSFSAWLTFLLSFSALRDWAKLAVLGGFIELCRRFVFGGYQKLVNSFFITACFEEEDSSYEWMMVWLSKQDSWRHVRDVQVSTNTLANNAAIVLDGEDEAEQFKSSRKLAYLPSLSTTYHLWYKRRWMTVSRVQTQTGWYGSKEQTLYISIMTRDHRILNSLLQEARKYYIAAQEHKMCVYVSDTNNNWRHVACRDKRSMQSIILDPGVKDVLIEDAKDFLASKDWYAERGIPHRRGYLLYGAPGSGKTSFIHSIAGELGLDVYIISLSRTGLDDNALSELVNALPEKCIALMEDIDAALTGGLNREVPAPDSQEGAAAKPAASGAPPTTSRLSLSGLLNALDGVGAQEGRILFATTNKYEALDPALCRPGRMDLHIEFKLTSKYMARNLFCRFYLPTQDPDAVLNEKEEGSVDSGYNSTAGEESNEKLLPSPAESTSESSSSASVSDDEKPAYSGRSHSTRAPKLKRRKIHEFAEKFSQCIPEREISMASLQGYLMGHKTRPFEAVVNASAWVEKERHDKIARERKASEVEAEKAKAIAMAKEKEAEKAKQSAAEKEEKLATQPTINGSG